MTPTLHINRTLIGALSERPDPSREVILWIDKDTGLQSVADGTQWVDVGGGAAPATAARYAQVGNGDGQTITHGLPDYTPFVLDYANELGSDFTLTLGDDHITIVTPGIYLAMGSIYIDDTALGSGEITGTVLAPGIFAALIPAPAAITDVGNAYAMRLLVVSSAPTDVQFGVIQTDSVDHLLGMDASILRWGDVPA